MDMFPKDQYGQQQSSKIHNPQRWKCKLKFTTEGPNKKQSWKRYIHMQRGQNHPSQQPISDHLDWKINHIAQSFALIYFTCLLRIFSSCLWKFDPAFQNLIWPTISPPDDSSKSKSNCMTYRSRGFIKVAVNSFSHHTGRHSLAPHWFLGICHFFYFISVVIHST